MDFEEHRRAVNQHFTNLLRQAKEYDEFLQQNLEASLLEELAGNDKFFLVSIARGVLLTALIELNEKFNLEQNIAYDADLGLVLDGVLNELSNRAGDDPLLNAEIQREIDGIFYFTTKSTENVFEDLKKVVQAKNREKTLNHIKNFFKPLSNLLNAIVTRIQQTYHHWSLGRQMRAGAGFETITQSTHLDSVHRSVKRSIDKLDQRNPQPGTDDISKILKEIEQHIKTTDGLTADQKTYAFNTLNRAKNEKSIEPGSGRTIAQALASIWVAAKDTNAYEASQTPDEDQVNRMNAIVQNLALADREYNLSEAGIDMGGPSKPACLGGTVNKIIESLEMIHPDVVIIRGQAILSDISISEYQKIFRELSDEKQRIMASDDDALDEQKAEIFKEIQDKVKIRLDEINQDIFGGDVEETKLQEYLDALEWVAIPETPATKAANAPEEVTIEAKSELAVLEPSAMQKNMFKIMYPKNNEDVEATINFLQDKMGFLKLEEGHLAWFRQEYGAPELKVDAVVPEKAQAVEPNPMQKNMFTSRYKNNNDVEATIEFLQQDKMGFLKLEEGHFAWFRQEYGAPELKAQDSQPDQAQLSEFEAQKLKEEFLERLDALEGWLKSNEQAFHDAIKESEIRIDSNVNQVNVAMQKMIALARKELEGLGRDYSPQEHQQWQGKLLDQENALIERFSKMHHLKIGQHKMTIDEFAPDKIRGDIMALRETDLRALQAEKRQRVDDFKSRRKVERSQSMPNLRDLAPKKEAQKSVQELSPKDYLIKACSIPQEQVYQENSTAFMVRLDKSDVVTLNLLKTEFLKLQIKEEANGISVTIPKQEIEIRQQAIKEQAQRAHGNTKPNQ